MFVKKSVSIESVESFLTEKLEGVAPLSAWGETSYFYNPGHRLKRGTYFATIKQKDGENDKGSKLDRADVWRLNIGLSKPAYEELFGAPPMRPAKGGVVEGPWDFAALDQIMPHPVYGWMRWIAVLSPSKNTWENCIPLLLDGHSRAQAIFNKRTG